MRMSMSGTASCTNADDCLVIAWSDTGVMQQIDACSMNPAEDTNARLTSEMTAAVDMLRGRRTFSMSHTTSATGCGGDSCGGDSCGGDSCGGECCGGDSCGGECCGGECCGGECCGGDSCGGECCGGECCGGDDRETAPSAGEVCVYASFFFTNARKHENMSFVVHCDDAALYTALATTEWNTRPSKGILLLFPFQYARLLFFPNRPFRKNKILTYTCSAGKNVSYV